MNKYIAINIGPIVDTLSMVRRPRHLWSASYLFSYLMGIIIDKAAKIPHLSLVSPAVLSSNNDMVFKDAVVGLYPDRAFFKCEEGCNSNDSIKEIIDESYNKLCSDLKVVSLKEYINIMGVECEAESESTAILILNQKLDVLELAVGRQPHSIDKVLDLITPSNGWRGSSPLFKIAFDFNSKFKIRTIEQIASVQISKPASYTHHRYFCVVQADGDSMGKVIANLKDEKLQDLSKELIQFGKEASNLVEQAGGVPIYAGGDDLLFIAPIITAAGETIFDLINSIDECYTNVQQKASKLQKDGNRVATTMSYGVAMSYHKHPLYEVLATARHLLFDVAKKYDGKNCVTVDLRKHSGSNLQLILSKFDIKRDGNASNFIRLCSADQSETMVSAVAHKLRKFSSLFMSLQNDRQRLDAFFDKYMSMDDKQESDNNYISIVKDILGEIYVKSAGVENVIEESIYATLRIAKFIKGEEIKDEL